MDGLPVGLADVGPWGLLIIVVAFVFRAMMKGDLVPRKTHEDALHNADMWRAAHMISEQARQEERDQKRDLLAYAKLGTHVVTSLPGVSAATNDEGT